jgi:hypothetical protein
MSRLIPYAELEVAGDATLEADLRGMFRREPDRCWFRSMTLPVEQLRRSAVAPETYLLGEGGGADHYREARALRELYRAGAHLPPLIVYLPEQRAWRETPELLDGYHRLSAAMAAGLELIDVLLLVDADGSPLRPLTADGTARRGRAGGKGRRPR